MEVEYYETKPGQNITLHGRGGDLAVITGLAPNEPVFVFRGRDLAFPAAFDAWWAEVGEHLTLERGLEASLSAAKLATWAAQNPEQARLPD